MAFVVALYTCIYIHNAYLHRDTMTILLKLISKRIFAYRNTLYKIFQKHFMLQLTVHIQV